MKIAVLSDIHSNVFALEAVMDDLKDQNPHHLLNLGDIFYGPIAPKATYELLKKYDFITIQGNQDRLLYEVTQADIANNPTMNYVLDDLGREPISWVKSLPPQFHLNNKVYLCHGSPTDDMEYLLEDIRTGYPRLRSDSDIITSLQDNPSEIILCGHTHVPRTVQINSGQLIINPGSVGLPSYSGDEPVAHSMENYSPHASYSIIEKKKTGWKIEHIKVPYDHKTAIKKASDNHRKDWGHFLGTGRGL